MMGRAVTGPINSNQCASSSPAAPARRCASKLRMSSVVVGFVSATVSNLS